MTGRAIAIGVLLIVCLLVVLRESRTRAPASPTGSAPTESPPQVEPGGTVELSNARVPEVERAPSMVPPDERAIRGRVVLPRDVPCGAGLVFAWPDGVVPRAESFGTPSPDGPLRSARVQPDGTFRIAGLEPGTRYTLGAAARGALCIERRTGVAPGAEDVLLELWFTYGVTVRLEEIGHEPLRTSVELFGKGPLISGPGHRVLVDPPELHALDIVGLDPGPVTRDRWRHLLVAEEELSALGPIEHEVEVPGYHARKTTLFAPRLLDRLEELVVELEPRDVAWSGLATRIGGVAQLQALGLAPETLLGVVYLTPLGSVEPVHFGVHARALDAWEALEGLPSGEYEAYFEAADAYYQTEPVVLSLGPGRNELDLHCGDAGSLLVDVRAGDEAHDGRFVARVVDEDGTHFFVTFERGPYVVPTLLPGVYRLEQVEVPGLRCAAALGEVEVFAGRLSVARVECR